MVIFKIKELRIAKGWTQRQLAEASGVSKSQIDRIERNESKPSFETIRDIAHALGATLDEIHEYHYTEKPQSQ